jgi:hypothetical protein
MHELSALPFLYRTTQHEVQRPLLLDRSHQIKRFQNLCATKKAPGAFGGIRRAYGQQLLPTDSK